ncbi:PREDICTED: LIM/homeobox protein Lhx3 [Myotis brandtii]|uniref:LIM/homeobox protein Lhx3 n=1 Tax=Myotis brandtii TaxID=109478 RepID=UPI0003BB6F70|nr:PREDICTED: LIM/homeobox protein Lhx3 [Myotis brandtii]
MLLETELERDQNRPGATGAAACTFGGTREIPLCAGCDQHILDRFILKALDRHWHSKCLKCSDCHTPLAERCFSRGESVYCKDDFFKLSTAGLSEGDWAGLALQHILFLRNFVNVEAVVKKVWFQNRRAKEKRLKKDAGRQRWGQYFRSMKRARGAPKSDKDSVQEEGPDSDAEVSFTEEPAMAEMGPANGLYNSLGEPTPALGRPSGAPGSFPLEHRGLAGPGPEQFRELRPGSPYGVPPSPAALQSLPGPQPLLSSLVYPDAGLGLVPTGAPGGPPPMRVLAGNGPSSDLSTGSSGGYPDFPASPASWLDEVDHAQF